MPANLIIDVSGVTARLTDVSTIDTIGRGTLSRVDPEEVVTITYTAHIPANIGLAPGPAQIWVAVAYDEDKCPAVEPRESPRIPINILAPRKTSNGR
jgi:hypothetical protein